MPTYGWMPAPVYHTISLLSQLVVTEQDSNREHQMINIRQLSIKALTFSFEKKYIAFFLLYRAMSDHNARDFYCSDRPTISHLKSFMISNANYKI